MYTFMLLFYEHCCCSLGVRCVILAHRCTALTHWLVLATRKVVGTDRAFFSTFCVWRRITELQSVSHIAVLINGLPFVTSHTQKETQFQMNPFAWSEFIAVIWHHLIVKPAKCLNECISLSQVRQNIYCDFIKSRYLDAPRLKGHSYHSNI